MHDAHVHTWSAGYKARVSRNPSRGLTCGGEPIAWAAWYFGWDDEESK